MSEPQLVFLRDLADVEPPRDRYGHYDEEDIYRLVPRPQWTGLEDEIWTPRSQEHDPQLEKVKALMKRNAAGGQGDASPGMNALLTTNFANKCARREELANRASIHTPAQLHSTPAPHAQRATVVALAAAASPRVDGTSTPCAVAAGAGRALQTQHSATPAAPTLSTRTRTAARIFSFASFLS